MHMCINQQVYQLININLNDGNPHNRDANQDENKDPTHNQKLSVAWPEVRNMFEYVFWDHLKILAILKEITWLAKINLSPIL